MKKNKTICYVAGKSGGHIIPCLTHAAREKREHRADKILFFTTNSKLDKDILSSNSIIDMHVALPYENFPGKKIWRYPYFFYTVIASIIQSLIVLIRERPIAVISMGGLVSIPVCFAARILRIDVILYELNVKPGKAIMQLAPWAKEVYIMFQETKKYFPTINCTKVSYPVRYSESVLLIKKEEAQKRLGLSKDYITILVLGGSQGSLFLNNLIKRLYDFDKNIFSKVQVILQAGGSDNFDWSAWYVQNNIPATIFAFKDDLSDCYVAADMIICRSGAGTLAETLFFKKPCITIPLQTAATEHQILNAHAYAKEYPHLFSVCQQADLEESIEALYKQIIRYLK
ncbi:MAG TPA: UDP-N-acetylglucosamine--N-acetylmuramyl-(pentapeptide) pyrophosphoryl-undecaprenol N-acetylglucosamine transferase [Candidatus Babeliales bacterium]|nr:UDP-N-acetylglucosamine--N-acetylmuramyl-(pentapeptide) pyrophosphoryl-undecaprenol N-acetylglucosamine transferase [Candidatus Babeliales bacterium]